MKSITQKAEKKQAGEAKTQAKKNEKVVMYAMKHGIQKAHLITRSH